MTAMVCESGVGLLMDYLDNAMASDMRVALDAHVAGCARCAAFVQSYRETPRIFREATTIDIPSTLRASLRTRLRDERGG